jgi:hypothetical protein
MSVGPKLTSHKKQKVGNATIDIFCWRHPKGWTKEECDICIKYYQLQAKKLGMNIARYMREFH